MLRDYHIHPIELFSKQNLEVFQLYKNGLKGLESIENQYIKSDLKNKKRDKPKKEDLSRVVHLIDLFSKQSLQFLLRAIKFNSTESKK